MDISLLTDNDRNDWGRFVDDHLDGGLFHHLGWKEVIEGSYGHKCLFLVARDGEALTGILPLVLIKSRLFGNSLTSLPFLDSAGLLANGRETEQHLLTEAIKLGMEHRVDYLELRQARPITGDVTTDTHKVTLTLELNPEHESMWKCLPSERRNRIRKAEKSSIRAEIGDRSLLPVFYDIWAANMRDLGSPPHTIRFFDSILRVFSPFSRLILVKIGEKYIGGALCLYFKKRFVVPWVSSLREHFDFYPNNVLYWEAMKYAADEGCEIFDFGRSTVGSGTYTFKIRWGAVEEPLYWQFKVFKGDAPDVPSTENPKYRLALALWKRLPVGITKLIGPKIRKSITA